MVIIDNEVINQVDKAITFYKNLEILYRDLIRLECNNQRGSVNYKKTIKYLEIALEIKNDILKELVGTNVNLLDLRSYIIRERIVHYNCDYNMLLSGCAS